MTSDDLGVPPHDLGNLLQITIHLGAHHFWDTAFFLYSPIDTDHGIRATMAGEATHCVFRWIKMWLAHLPSVTFPCFPGHELLGKSTMNRSMISSLQRNLL